jgi:hypothetical protein
VIALCMAFLTGAGIGYAMGWSRGDKSGYAAGIHIANLWSKAYDECEEARFQATGVKRRDP